MATTPRKTAASSTPAKPVTDDEFWATLTRPFADDEIELLPKPFSKDSTRGTCTQPDRNGESCGGYHGLPAVHLSYVGHAGITTRLNEVCGPDGWNWEPFTLDPSGLPGVLNGGLWIRLSITPPSGTPVVKIGYGDAPGKSNPTKELIGDALRNAAMRFGVGTYLWSKSDRAKGLLARGDAASATPAQDPWESASPAPARQQHAETTRQERPATGQAAAGETSQDPEPHPAVASITEGISHLNDFQKSWLIDQWTAKGWPPIKGWTKGDTPDHAVTEAQALLKQASEQEDAPPF
jgi:hypothetical protein